MRSLCIVLVAGILALPATAEKAAGEVHAIAERVDRHYQGLRSLTAGFTETYQRSGAPQRVESGTVWLERGGKMRWEYQQPREKLFLSDGKTAYFYVPGEHQARRTALRDLDDLRSPLRYLLGKSRLEKEFQELRIITPEDGNGLVRLEGVPRGMRDRIARVSLVINVASQIERIEIEEVDGALTSFVFRDPVENAPVPAGRFQLALPKGVEIVDSELP
jgi:outer membrane lipoprotein carrier protein